MAAILRLANRAQSVTVNLLTGTLKLRDQSWTANTPAPIGTFTHEPYGAQSAFHYYPPVVETLDLVATDTTANLRAAMNDLEDILAQARRWHTNTVQDNSIWFEWNADGEGAKRALLYGGSLQVLRATGISPLMERTTLLVRLTLLRHPLFENTSQTQQEINPFPLWGSIYEIPAPVYGNEPARIISLITGGLTGGGGPLYRLWAGIRDPYQGTTHFHPFWELEDGTAGTDAAAGAVTGASGGDAVSVDFSTTTTLAKRVSITVAQAVPDNYDDLVGRYLILLRCKVGAGITAGLQLRSGYAIDTTFTPCEEVYITNTAWRLIPLGEATIPPAGYRGLLAGATQVGAAQLQVWAELAAGTAGAGALVLDTLVLIPAEHLAYCSGAEIQDVAGDPRPVYFGTLEDDTDLALSWRGGVPSISLDFGLTDFYLPTGNPVVVIAAEGATAHVLTDEVRVIINYVTRWLSYRET